MKKAAIFILLSIVFFRLPAQVKTAMDSLHDYCAICNDHQHLIILPPYTKKLTKELPYLITSGVMLGAGFLAQSMDKVKPYTEEQLNNNAADINSINSIDRSSALNWSTSIGQTSDYVLMTVSILPAAFLVENHTGRDIKTLLIMYAEVFSFNYGLTVLAKSTAHRARPYVYNPEVDIGKRTSSDSRASFFSGHTSQTAAASFYFAKVITDYHPTMRKGLKTGMWIFAVAAPALNGYFRVKAGKHFPTDVITGYIAGAATGWLIPQLHRTKSSKDQKEKIQIGFVPSGQGMLLTAGYRF